MYEPNSFLYHMGFADGGEWAHVRSEETNATVDYLCQPPVQGWFNWVVSNVGKKNACDMIEEDYESNELVWSDRAMARIEEYELGCQEGANHFATVLFGNKTAGS